MAVKNDETKTIYRLARENRKLTREKASELTGLEDYKIERIETEKIKADPWDVVAMADAYKTPQLCNYFCSNECPIGMKYVPEIKIRDLAQVVLEMLASLNTMEERQKRLIEITADGVIQNEELADFVAIQQNLAKISTMADTLQLWTEQMIAEGKIDAKQYKQLTKK